MSNTNVKSRWADGNLTFAAADGTTLAKFDGSTLKALFVPGEVRNVRARVARADVNSGYTILPALAGYKYRIVDWSMIAIGGAAQTATSVDIVTTQAASAVRPAVVAVAALTQSAVVKPNSANCTVLADGASFVANDAGTAVTLSKQAAGSGLATATHIDILLTYTIEEA